MFIRGANIHFTLYMSMGDICFEGTYLRSTSMLDKEALIKYILIKFLYYIQSRTINKSSSINLAFTIDVAYNHKDQPW